MATANLNPILSTISGRVGNVVFYRRKNTICVRTHVIPHNPDTKAQRNIRSRFALAVKSWHGMSNEEKYRYSRKARCLNMSGYNLYISEFMKKEYAADAKTKQVPENMLNSYSLQLRFPSVSYFYNQANREVLPFILLQNDTG